MLASAFRRDLLTVSVYDSDPSVGRRYKHAAVQLT